MPSDPDTTPETDPPHRLWDIVHAEWDAAIAKVRDDEGLPRLNDRSTFAEVLPAGWRVVSTFPYGDGYIDWHLARREAGGWVLFSVAGEDHELQFGSAVAALSTLYDQNDASLRSGGGAPMAALRAHVRWYRDVLLSLYNPTDPDEAAAQMLFALSGVLRTPPKADR